MTPIPGQFRVDLPGGGTLYLQSADEVDMWDRSMAKYIEDYHLTRLNDLILLGAILQQQVVMYRAQIQMNGQSPILDAQGVPTGTYKVVPVKSDEMASAMSTLSKATDQIRLLEKALGLDKVPQPLYAPVLTPTGWRAMGDLAIGDLVIGSDGVGVPITDMTDYPDGAIYRLTCNDTGSAECEESHLWPVTYEERLRSGSSCRPRMLREIAETLTPGKHCGGTGNRWLLPTITSPVVFEQGKSLPLHPYVLGVLLGDGYCRVGEIAFTNSSDEVIRRVASHLPASLKLTSRPGTIAPKRADAIRNNQHRIVKRSGGQSLTHEVMTAVKELGLLGKTAKNKFIPTSYMLASPEDRLELLRGLVDTDGHITVRTGAVMYCTIGEQLANDVLFLVRSLGGQAGLGYSPQQAPASDLFTVTARLPKGVKPAYLKRKLINLRDSKHRIDHRAVTKVAYVGRRPCRCITVANTDGLYVTEGFLLTHNSREAGGQHTLANYLKTLKTAAHLRGLHVSKRVIAYEKFVNDLRWRIRVLHNADPEDRAYHDLTPDKILVWCADELKVLEDADIKFANERGRIYVGQL